MLDPKTWPSAYQVDFGLEYIHELYDLVKPPGATKQEVYSQWKIMVKAIIADDEFCKYKKDLLNFWKHYLETPLVPDAMSAMVVRILSVPVGSADGERAFSHFGGQSVTFQAIRSFWGPIGLFWGHSGELSYILQDVLQLVSLFVCLEYGKKC